MAKIKFPRYTMQTLTAPTTVSEAGSKLPVPSPRHVSMLSPAQQQALGALVVSSPRSAQVYPAGSVVITSTEDGSVRVISASQYAQVFETAPEGGGKVRAASQPLATLTVQSGLAITTNSDGTINTGGPGSVVVTNASTGEQRVVSSVDYATNFEQT